MASSEPDVSGDASFVYLVSCGFFVATLRRDETPESAPKPACHVSLAGEAATFVCRSCSGSTCLKDYIPHNQRNIIRRLIANLAPSSHCSCLALDMRGLSAYVLFVLPSRLDGQDSNN